MYGLIEELNRRAKEHPLTIDEYGLLINTLLAEKEKCIIADGRYEILSIALDWAIQKKKETCLEEIGFWD